MNAGILPTQLRLPWLARLHPQGNGVRTAPPMTHKVASLAWSVSLPGAQTDPDIVASLRWSRAFLARFDCSMVESIRIEKSRRRSGGVCGRCTFPNTQRPMYRLLCQVPGPFPSRIVIRKPPLYRAADGSWPALPPGTQRGTHFVDRRTGREWVRVYGSTHLQTVGQGVVWIVAHEAFHFLRRTRQVPGRNTEIDADAFADAQLRLYLRGAEPVHDHDQDHDGEHRGDHVEQPAIGPFTLGSAALSGLRRVLGL
jgi:hypothetical protein